MKFMRFRKCIYVLIGIPLLLHAMAYLISIPYAKPYLERTVSDFMKSEFRVDKAEIFLLTRSVHLTNPRLVMRWEGKECELFRAHKIKICIKLLPLLAGRLIIQNIVLHAPAVKLERSAGGDINIRSLFKTIDAAHTPGATVPSAADTGSKHAALKMYLQKIYIKGGEISFTDNRLQPPLSMSLADLKFFTVFTYDYGKQTLESIKIKLNGLIRSEQPTTLKIDGEIDPEPGYVGSTFRMNAYIDNFDITSIWPYIGEDLPLTLDAGRISIESHLNCIGGTFEDSRQTVQIKSLTIRSWKEDFSANKTMGLSNQAIMKFIEKNCNSLAFDFYISGTLKDLKVTPGELMLKMVGEKLLKKTTENNNEQGRGT